ncbi:MAG: barstar family protein [Thermoflexaceae bacterium]|nr:barstar family protein [Thermoflexaceae bacterium]
MISIILDGSEIADREQLHKIFRDALQLEDYYGCNLDALYDVLSTYSEQVEITVRNEEILYSNLPFYGERLMGMLRVAAEENEPYIIIKMGDEEPEEELW